MNSVTPVYWYKMITVTLWIVLHSYTDMECDTNPGTGKDIDSVTQASNDNCYIEICVLYVAFYVLKKKVHWMEFTTFLDFALHL